MRLILARDHDHALEHHAIGEAPHLTIDGLPVFTLWDLRAGALRHATTHRLRVRLLPDTRLTIDDRAELYRLGARITR